MRILILIVVLAIAGVTIAQDAVVGEAPVDETAAAADAAAIEESDVMEDVEPVADAEVVEEPPVVDAYAEAEDVMLHLCMECHGDIGHDAGFKLPTTREGAGMAGVPSIQRTDLMLIDLEKPESSYLIMKLRDDAGILGKRMPIVRLLDEEQLSMFDLWVAELSDAYLATLEPEEVDAVDVDEDADDVDDAADVDDDDGECGDADDADDDDDEDQE